MTVDSVTPAKVPWIAVAVFVVLANALAWLAALPLWLDGGLENPAVGIILVAIMFTPMVSALFVVFVVQRPRPASIASYLGLWPIRPVKRTLWMIVIAIFGSMAIVIAGVFLAAALGLVRLDLATFSGFADQLAALGAPALPIPIQAIVAIQLLTLPLGALINGVFTIGEELGWRGWLLPSLRPLGTWPALLITGAVWGLWHSPIILLGYNFGEPNLFGVALMTTGCVFYGVIVGWLRLRSGSIWPAVFAHGAFNASGGVILLLAVSGTSVSTPALNPIGWVTWIVMALVIVILLVTGQFAKQPSLERRQAR